MPEVTNTLGENQWGFRPNYSVDNVAFIDVFITEVNHLFKIQRDAKYCFDRIINSHAILNIHKFEVIDKICKMHSLILCNTKYRVQTAFDTSLNHLKNFSTTPIHGTRKRLGSICSHWVYIVVPMMENLDK